MPTDKIVIRGARAHNLKNISLELPRDRLIVVTGVSGSGKSSLAFDTIYAEGQRRYVESLSAYARQFLGQMEKPEVDSIEGLSPSIAIDQKGASNNPRSTVGTVTETYDFFRLLYARVGIPHCPSCGRVVSRQTVQGIVDSIVTLPDGSRLMIVAPVVTDRKGEHQQILSEIRRAGFTRIRLDGDLVDLADEVMLDRNRKHTVEVVVDRLVIRHDNMSNDGPDSDAVRIADSVQTALKLGSGLIRVVLVGSGGADQEEMIFSEHFACAYCGVSLGEIEPRTLSFNSPAGACTLCSGLGTTKEFDPELVFPFSDQSLADGAIRPWGLLARVDRLLPWLLESACRYAEISFETPTSGFSAKQRDFILFGPPGGRLKLRAKEDQYGDDASLALAPYSASADRAIAAPKADAEPNVVFDGVMAILKRLYNESKNDRSRWALEEYMSPRACSACRGQRLNSIALGLTIADLSIVQATKLSIADCLEWVHSLEGKSDVGRDGGFTERQWTIASPILKEIGDRLRFLVDVGLGYLTLSRPSGTLSGGESQRIRLATQIGSALVGVLYVLDEPSIGLHQRDNARLIKTLLRLRDLGNTVLVVEHDEETIRIADHIVDIGPGAGEHGGRVIVSGTLADVLESKESLTGQYLRGERQRPAPLIRREGSGKSIVIEGARANNLKNLNVTIPLGKLVCVTGVSGSGKSTLVNDILYRRAAQALNRTREHPAEHRRIRGLDQLEKVISVDQSPLGQTPRSNPATYTGLFGPIRELFASMPEARTRGYQPGRFSFNIKGGRCEACQGDGTIKIEMQFLPDIYVTCEVCGGQRYGRETLQIRYKGLSIAETLNLTVSEALTFFEAVPPMRSRLQVLDDVGLGYLRLGQSATTLSGGEAQRVKLSSELSKRSNGRTLYVLDEPTTGLHFADVERLIQVLNRLVDAGNTVLVVEHNLDILKSADWLIDLGPEGGDEGGYLVAEGTPESVAECDSSYTGQVLRQALGQEVRR